MAAAKEWTDLGLYTTTSSKWSVSYIAGWSLYYGEHTMIFFGCENLDVAIFTFKGVGIAAQRGLKVKKGKLPRGGRNRVEGDPLDQAQEGINMQDAAGDLSNVDDIDNGIDLFRKQRENPSLISPSKPFSLNDLNGRKGHLYGISVDVIVAGAQLFNISADGLFAQKTVYNDDDGSIGAGFATMRGTWSLDRAYNLYIESSGQPANARPFRNLYHSPRWIRDLPPAGHSPLPG